MKIAVFHNLPSGGAKRALFYHVRGLVERGHDVEAWCLDDADQTYLPLSQLVSEHVRPSTVNGHHKPTIARRLAPRFYEAVDRLQRFDDACRDCAAEIESRGYDVVFANSSSSFYVPYIIRHLSLPKVLYLQEPCRYVYEAAPILPWVSGATGDLAQASAGGVRTLMSDYPVVQTLRLRAKQEWLNAQACDYLLVNSYYSRETVLRTYGVDAKVCYLGVDTKLFRNLHLPRQRFIVGLGSFDSIKRVDLAVRAVALLSEPRPPLVWIANSGNAAYENEVSKLARSLNVDLRIKRAISDDELVTTLNQATLMLYTSRLEPFGLAPLEGNACGLPVVGVAEGGVRETIHEGINGILVDDQPEAIALVAERWLNDPQLCAEIGEKASRYIATKWTIEQSVERVESYLAKAAAKGSNKRPVTTSRR